MFRILLAVLMTIAACLPPSMCTCIHAFCSETSTKDASAAGPSISKTKSCGCTDEPVSNEVTSESNGIELTRNHHGHSNSGHQHSTQCNITQNGTGFVVAQQFDAILYVSVQVVDVLPLVSAQLSVSHFVAVDCVDKPIFVLVCSYLV